MSPEAFFDSPVRVRRAIANLLYLDGETPESIAALGDEANAGLARALETAWRGRGEVLDEDQASVRATLRAIVAVWRTPA